jgi:hypothetical protein
LPNLVPITPVEYSRSRITRYYGYQIDEIDADSLMSIFAKVNVQCSPNIWAEDGVVFYQYPGQPSLAIKAGKLFTTEEVWEGRVFSHARIRHQASILLRILGKFGLARFNRKAIPRRRFTPHQWRTRT